jgi:hypothetical protein
VRNALKNRLITTGLALAALPIVICSVAWAHATVEASLNLCPWAHMTLEASLNLLWLLLAVGSLTHWIAPEGRRYCAHLRGLITLVFVLSLLFPVISANDDLAQRDLTNDGQTSQAMVIGLKSGKYFPDSAGLLGSPATLAFQWARSLPLASEFVSEPVPGASVTTPGDATGNHSPPVC